MFFGYPISATQDNWLHNCIVGMMKAVNDLIERGKRIPEWSRLIPDENKAQLKYRVGLKKRFEEYIFKFQRLSGPERQLLMRELERQNNIEQLLSDTTVDCGIMSSFPMEIIPSLKDLYDFAYGILTDLGLRDKLYHIIYEYMDKKRCPFCLMERFDFPTAPREDFDHYLPKSIYPFAAINLRNLVPMGKKCNEVYKRSKDILRNSSGRRRAFDPYGDIPTIKISLNESMLLPEDQPDVSFGWKVSFDPMCDRCETWDELFDIRTRYVRDCIEPEYTSWLKYFSEWTFKKNFECKDNDDLLRIISMFISMMKDVGTEQDNFLKVRFFEAILQHCQSKNQRLIDFAINLIKK